MRLLGMCDLHCSYDRPRNRTDNWLEAIQNKLNQIVQIYKENKCDATICAGDIFEKHHNTELDYFFTMIYYFFASMNSYTAIGNHCSKSTSGDLSNTTLGALVSAGAIKVNDRDVCVDFFDFYNRNSFYETKNSKNRIAIIHDYITPQKQTFPFETHSFDDLENPYDLVIAGHLHTPLDYTRKDGKRLYNSGCVLRRTIAETHSPKVFILDTETLEIKEIFLNVKPFEEVFKAKVEDKIVHLATDIISQIEQDNQYNGLSIEQRIEAFANERKTIETVTKESLKRLAQAKQKIS